MAVQQLTFTVINEYLPSVPLQNNVDLLPIQEIRAMPKVSNAFQKEKQAVVMEQGLVRED